MTAVHGIGTIKEKKSMCTKSITEQFEEIKEEMCDKYCRFTELSLETHEDPDEANEWLMKQYCENCPLTRL
jgi:hypothetical protein